MRAALGVTLGVDACALLRRTRPNVRVVVVADADDDADRSGHRQPAEADRATRRTRRARAVALLMLALWAGVAAWTKVMNLDRFDLHA
mgnify:CR=1 FL=1